MLVVFSGLYFSRFWGALVRQNDLAGLLSFTPVYLAVSGLFWALISFALALYLWLGRKMAPRLTIFFVMGYTIYYWLEYNFLVDHRGLSSNWPFLVIVNFALALWILWVLSRPMTRDYFGENNGRRLEN